MHLVHVNAAKERLLAAGGGYEVVHSSPGLEVGVYVLVAPEPDRQQPHADDELYDDLVQRSRELPPEPRTERVLRPQLVEERDHEPAELVTLLRVVRLSHLAEEKLERRLVVVRLERREQVAS